MRDLGAKDAPKGNRRACTGTATVELMRCREHVLLKQWELDITSD